MTHSRQKKWAGVLFIAPYATVFTAFVVIPLILALWLAFVRLDLANKGASEFVGFGNFQEAFNDQFFWRALQVTAWYAILMVPATLILGFAIGLGMHAMSRGRDMARALIYLPSMLNVAAAGILWQWFYNNEFGLFNFILKQFGMAPVPWIADKAYAMSSVVLMSLWWTVGGTSVVLLTALQQIPRMYFEAAAIDGATPNKMFSKITVPLIKPVLLFVFITGTIGAFQMFGQALILTGGQPEFSTRGLVQYMVETAFNGYRFGYGAAISWILFMIVLVFAGIQVRLVRSQP